MKRVVSLFIVFLIAVMVVPVVKAATIYNGYYDGVYTPNDELSSYSWGLTFYLDKEGNLLLANAIDDTYFYDNTIKIATDVKEYDLTDKCEIWNDEEDDYIPSSCTADSYVASEAYKEVKFWKFMGVTTTCDSLNLTGDALSFCQRYLRDGDEDNENKFYSASIFQEQGDVKISASVTDGLKKDAEGYLVLEIDADYFVNRLKVKFSDAFVITGFELPSKWKVEEPKDGDEYYYFKNENTEKEKHIELKLKIKAKVDFGKGTKVTDDLYYLVSYPAFITKRAWIDEDDVLKDCSKPFRDFGIYFGFDDYYNSEYCLSSYYSETVKGDYYSAENPDEDILVNKYISLIEEIEKEQEPEQDNPLTKSQNNTVLFVIFGLSFVYIVTAFIIEKAKHEA